MRNAWTLFVNLDNARTERQRL